MKRLSLPAAAVLSLLLVASVQAQESFVEGTPLLHPFRYPEIVRVTEWPANGEANRFDLELADAAESFSAAPRYGDNYWKEGMILGGVLTLLLLVSAVADDPGALPLGQTVGITLVVAALLGTVGALVGGAIPK